MRKAVDGFLWVRALGSPELRYKLRPPENMYMTAIQRHDKVFFMWILSQARCVEKAKWLFSVPLKGCSCDFPWNKRIKTKQKKTVFVGVIGPWIRGVHDPIKSIVHVLYTTDCWLFWSICLYKNIFGAKNMRFLDNECKITLSWQRRFTSTVTERLSQILTGISRYTFTCMEEQTLETSTFQTL